MIAKFIALSERWFVVDLFLSFVLILLSAILSIYYGQAMWTLQFYVYVAEMAAHAQAVDTKPFLSHTAWV